MIHGANRFRIVVAAAIVLVVVGTSTSRAGIVYQLASNDVSAFAASELDDLAKTVFEVNEATRSFEKHDLEACLKQLEKAVKAHPELPPAQALLAKLALSRNQIRLVRPALETAVARAPDHPEIYILFGNLALLENRATDAALHFEKVRALAANERWTADQRRRFDLLCNQGNAALAESRRDWKAARSALEAWLAREPSNASARQRLGQTLFMLGEYDIAYKELQKASQAETTLEAPEVRMAWLFTTTGNFTKAEEWMNFAVQTRPESLRVRMAITAWLAERGRGDEAETHARAAAKLAPKSNDVKRVLGLVARQRKDYVQSEAIFRALADESPGDSWVRNNLASVLAEQGDDAKRKRALELAELSVRQNPNAIDALVTVGNVYYRLKRLDDAQKVLQAVCKSGKANSDAAYFLALVESDSGRPDKAPSLLKKALSAPGLFIYRTDAQQLLDRLAATSK
jgi:tetratricopeptide (TPR) repeat protein